MKKIYSLMVAAVALFAAASCNKEISQEQLPVGETVVYTASVDGADTKAVLDGTVSKWCGEELITLHDGKNAFTFYANAGETPVLEVDFTYTPGEGQPAFTATEVMAIYPSGDYTANVSDKTVSNIVIPNNQTLADNTYPATSAVAVAHSTTTELSFKNATTLLKFKVAGDDVTFGCIAAEGDISGTFDLAYNDGEPNLTATTAKQWVDFSKNDEFLSKDATYYIAVAPAALNKITMYLNGTEVKSKTFEQPYQLKRNVILDLGTITYEAPEQASTIYLMPGEWASDDAKFAAYFYSSTGNTAVMMEDSDSDGAYEADVPEGGYSKVIFCRMDSATDSFDWEKKWNQTSNLTVPKATDDKLCYVITGWGEGEGANSVGEWKTLEDATYVAPEFVAEDGFIYLQPSSDWKADNARFAAYFFNETWADMILVEGQKDIYQCAIPDGEIDVIFCRMNPSAIENNWTNKWNQTADLKMTDGSLYVVSGWEEGSWTGNPAVAEPEPEQPEEVTPGQDSEWALLGVFSGWIDQTFVTTSVSNVVVLEDVKMKAAEGFLVRKPTTEWADKYGAGNVNYIQANSYITTAKDGGDMCLEADGTYDIYFNTTTKAIYVMTAGTDYTTAVEQTVSGKEPEVEEPEVTANILYLKPNSNWMADNARFAAYFFGGTPGEKWVSMTDSDADGIYEVNIPEGYDYGCNVIFCRMNPNTTANNWNNKWNQTSDLTAPTDGKNLYTVKDGTWDKGGGTWSTRLTFPITIAEGDQNEQTLALYNYLLDKYDLQHHVETDISEEIYGHLYDNRYKLNSACLCTSGHGKSVKVDPESIIFTVGGSGLGINKEGLVQYWSDER